MDNEENPSEKSKKEIGQTPLSKDSSEPGPTRNWNHSNPRKIKSLRKEGSGDNLKKKRYPLSQKADGTTKRTPKDRFEGRGQKG